MAPSETELPPLRDVIARYGLAARKSLGQHFLLDANLTGRIARSAACLATGTTIEVGPGPGGLTRALLAEGAGCVVAIERDERCLSALQDLADHFRPRLRVLEADALDVDMASLGEPPRRIVANLPYNISTALLIKWLGDIAREPASYQSLVLMFQKEVAQRLVAPPRSAAYGRLSVMTQWLTDVEALFDIRPRAFTPPPRVVSSLVRLQPLPQPRCPATWAAMEKVAMAAFGQRRKMLRQSLKTLGTDPGPLLVQAGLEATQRAEELAVEDFCALARALDGGQGRADG